MKRNPACPPRSPRGLRCGGSRGPSPRPSTSAAVRQRPGTRGRPAGSRAVSGAAERSESAPPRRGQGSESSGPRCVRRRRNRGAPARPAISCVSNSSRASPVDLVSGCVQVDRIRPEVAVVDHPVRDDPRDRARPRSRPGTPARGADSGVPAARHAREVQIGGAKSSGGLESSGFHGPSPRGFHANALLRRPRVQAEESQHAHEARSMILTRATAG